MITMRKIARKSAELSPRLAAAFAMLGTAHTVWDVGCDHGFLAAALINSGAAEQVIATDLSPVSVAKAARLASLYGIADRMMLAASDGLTGFEPEGDYKLALCGMGGELIAQILERGADIAHGAKLIVMQPMRGEDELRSYLCRSGYEIPDERVVLDDGRYYQLIAARHGGSSMAPPWFPKSYYRFGWVMCEKPDDTLLALLTKYRAVYAAQLNRAVSAGQRPQKLIEELAAVDVILQHFKSP